MFEPCEATKQKLYKTFERYEAVVEDDVRILKDWMKTQLHLPEVMEDTKIRNFLNLNKFSIEKTKRKIDMYYTIRGLIPEFFTSSRKAEVALETTYVSTLPKLLDDTHRVYITKQKRPNSFDALNLCNIWLRIFEIRLCEDFMVDDIIIVDMANYSVNDFAKMTPSLVAKFFSVYKNVYGLRMKKMICCNAPSFLPAFSALLKSVLQPKIFKRVEFHTDDAVVRRVLPKESLPRDYGGEGSSLDELNEMLKTKLREFHDRFDYLDGLRVAESLRPEKLDNDEVLGFYGSFKKMNVD